jgi:hypothetical protein
VVIVLLLPLERVDKLLKGKMTGGQAKEDPGRVEPPIFFQM